MIKLVVELRLDQWQQLSGYFERRVRELKESPRDENGEFSPEVNNELWRIHFITEMRQ